MNKISVRPLTNRRMRNIAEGLDTLGWFVTRKGAASNSTSDTYNGEFSIEVRLHLQLADTSCLLTLKRTSLYDLELTTSLSPVMHDPTVIRFMDALAPFLQREVAAHELLA